MLKICYVTRCTANKLKNPEIAVDPKKRAFKDTKVGTGWNEWVNWDPDTQYALKIHYVCSKLNIWSLVSQISKCQFYILYFCKINYPVSPITVSSSGHTLVLRVMRHVTLCLNCLYPLLCPKHSFFGVDSL